MAPPGRRCSIQLLPILLSALLAFSTFASAASAVIGVDIGTEYIKAALVKPGIPLEIVLSKDSKRKEASAVVFKPSRSGSPVQGSFPERSYGGDALALAARFPGEVYPNIKQLLGLPLKTPVVEQYRKRYPALEVVESIPRGTVAFKSKSFHKDEKPFAVEELLAMELKNLKENAQALAGTAHKVSNAVFTVPIFYTAEEKRALGLAAKLAGLNVLAMVSDGMAVGINYATSRTFEVGKPEYHLVFDMGAGSTVATVLRMQGKIVQDIGRFNKTVQEVAILGAGWDRTLGGDVLNTIIVDDMILKFLDTPKAKSLGKSFDDIKAHGRTISKLARDAEKVRQVLSANQETVASFEGLYEEVDFKYKISRTDFETLIGDFAGRMDGPIKQAMKLANVTFADLNSVILHGGMTRTPFVIKKLESLVGDNSKLRSNVNADEAAVFGAAFKAAQISPSFRVKDIVSQDAASYATFLQYSKDGKDKSQKLFTPTSSIGLVKQVPFTQLQDFSFRLYQSRGADGVAIPPSSYTIETKNLTTSVTHMVEKLGCKKEEITNKFSIRLDPIMGLPDVVRGVLSCQVLVEDKKAAGVLDSAKDFLGFGKKDQEPLKGDEKSSSTSSSSSDSKSTDSAKSNKKSKDNKDKVLAEPKKNTEIVHVEFTVTCDGCNELPSEELTRMEQRLTAFDDSDNARHTREADLNNLESFTYKVRDMLEDSAFAEFSTDAERAAIEKLLGETSEWLYEAGQDSASDDLRAKLQDLHALTDPIKKRQSEAAARPDAVKALEDTLSQTDMMQGVIKSAIDEANKSSSAAASSSAEAASKSSSEAEAASSSAAEASSSADASSSKDPLEELEEKESSTSSEAPIPTPEPIVSPTYKPEDFEKIRTLYTETKEWLAGKLAEQAKLSKTDDPAFAAKDVVAKTTKLHDTLMAILQRQIRYSEKAKAKAKATSTPKAKKAKKMKASSSASAEESSTVTFEVPKEEERGASASASQSVRDEL
ncbi:chaperone protein dnaK [Venturia nashicola]|uniref:Chaperone protein dnaK n=1 Tax=Venturia nashicola TaxID=86259 RepID=A0A4Z1NQY0_9PEZI|nr:chaperone protein dnaK [Venturia nashicola]